MNKQYCVISHTHWDREWYQSFEEYRYRFVKLMDNLLDIFKQYPNYIFHLDAQTHVVEDYLEIRPWRRDEVFSYVESGNLLVGPWYIQNDFNLTSGEATIRNLLIGKRLAESFGVCQNTGYAPDQFGIVSQIPQIFNGFGLKGCIFGRGYKKFKDVDGKLKQEHSPTEFIWQSPDGSEVLGISMHQWYNNAQRFSADRARALKLVKRVEADTQDLALTPYILMMNGVDHLEAQEDLLPILEQLNQVLPEGQHIEQTTLDRYVADVSAWLADNTPADFVTETGEMRHGANHILMNTLSSRVYLKQANFRAQNRLEAMLEPLYAGIFAMGAKDAYPHDHFRYLWRLLMENHPHDSICGCSVDDVHSEMETRFAKVGNLCDSLLEDGQVFITDHLDRSGMDESDHLLLLTNTTEVARHEVIEADLAFPSVENVTNFELYDADGETVPYVVLDKQQVVRRTLSPINLPGTLDVDSYRVQLLSNPLAPLSYEALYIKPCDGEVNLVKDTPSDTTLENENLSITIHENGQIDLTVLATGHTYTDVLSFVDREDCGESYLYRKSENGTTYRSSQFDARATPLPATPFRQQCRIEFDMELPTHFDYHHDRRAGETAIVPVSVMLTLDAKAQGLQVNIELDNTVKDHRLRAIFNTGYSTQAIHASQPFDVVTRTPHPLLPTHRNADEPNSGFVCVQGESDGLAVFNKGLYEYEYPAGGEGKLALTLVRSNNRFSGDGPYVVPPESLTPGNQVLRPLSFELMILPYQGDYNTAQVVSAAKAFHTPLLAMFQPVNRKTFTGGRSDVQDSEIKELFFRPLAHADIVLPRKLQFFDIDGENIELSALKRAEDGDYLVIRVWNSGDSDSTFGLRFHQNLKRVALLNLNEDVQQELPDVTSIPIKAKQIVTLGVWPQ